MCEVISYYGCDLLFSEGAGWLEAGPSGCNGERKQSVSFRGGTGRWPLCPAPFALSPCVELQVCVCVCAHSHTHLTPVSLFVVVLWDLHMQALLIVSWDTWRAAPQVAAVKVRTLGTWTSIFQGDTWHLVHCWGEPEPRGEGKYPPAHSGSGKDHSHHSDAS